MADQFRALKAIMFEKGVSQEELAKAIGVSETTLNSKLNGRSTFLVTEVRDVCSYLEISDPVRILDIFFKPAMR